MTGDDDYSTSNSKPSHQGRELRLVAPAERNSNNTNRGLLGHRSHSCFALLRGYLLRKLLSIYYFQAATGAAELPNTSST